MKKKQRTGQLLVDFEKIHVSDLADNLNYIRKSILRLGDTFFKLGRVIKSAY